MMERNAAQKGENTIAKWVCTVCGYVHEGEQPPEQCPKCNHPQAFFEVRKENY